MKGLDSSRSSSHNHRKNSSEVRRHQKRNKSKKRRRRRDASLSYSDDDKTKIASKSASSFDSYKERSRSRKKIRKKVRGSSSRDERPSSLRRRRKSETEAFKKSKKKRGGSRLRSCRDASVSSLSRDSSRSCSTCRERSHSSEDSEVERSRRRDFGSSRDKSGVRGRSDGGRKMSRISRKTSREKHGKRHRSRSYSSCSECSSRSHQSEEARWMEESSSKRRKMEEVGRRERDQSKDENEAEIIQADDDFPSSRSNDSNDGGRNRESEKVVSHNHHIVSEKKRKIEAGASPSLNGKEMFSPKIITRIIDDESRIDGQFGQNDPPEQSEIPASVGSSEVDDLELLLRQKALENFRKYRGRSSPNTKSIGGQNDESREGESIPIESHEEAGCKVGAIKETQNTKTLSTSVKWIPNPLSDAGFSASTLRTIPTKPIEKISGNAGKNKAMQGTLTSRPNSLVDHVKPEKAVKGTLDIVKQVPAVQESSNKMGILKQTSVTKIIPDKRIHETLNAAPRSSGVHGSETNNVDSSAAKPSPLPSTVPSTKDSDSTEPKDEAKGGSQFEQKTMSVMRGGERVQVSYKVYIPKKAPALAKRHLQR